MITEDELKKMDCAKGVTIGNMARLIAEVRSLQVERTKDNQMLRQLIDEKDAADKKIASLEVENKDLKAFAAQCQYSLQMLEARLPAIDDSEPLT